MVYLFVHLADDYDLENLFHINKMVKAAFKKHYCTIYRFKVYHTVSIIHHALTYLLTLKHDEVLCTNTPKVKSKEPTSFNMVQ